MNGQHAQHAPLDIFAGLNPDEQQQLYAMTVWLGEQAARLPRGERISPETLQVALSPLSDRVAARVARIADHFDAERHAPFEQRCSLDDYADRAGLDRDALRATKDGLDFCAVGFGVQDRMAKHDADRNQNSNQNSNQNQNANTHSLADTLRETIDARQPRTEWENAVIDDVRDSSNGLTLRQTIETLHDHIENEQQQQQQ